MDKKYLSKYRKYKEQYLNLKKNINSYNEGTYITNIDFPGIERASSYFDDDQLVTVETSDYYPIDLPGETTEEEEETINIFRIAPISEYEKEVLMEDGVYDIGIYGFARGKPIEKYNFKDDEFVKINDKPDKSKILLIDNIDDFDDFTYKYGKIAKLTDPTSGEYSMLYIRWDKVADNYKGFYLDQGINAERYEQAFYKDKGYKSWWSNEYEFDEVIIFKEIDLTMFVGKNITSPFKGEIYDYNSFTEGEYTNMFTKSKDKKILVLDDYNSFDTFTNTYGSIKKDKNKYVVKIDWNEVADKYNGIYLDADSKIYPDRYVIAHFDDKPYHSWWFNDKIKPGYVYYFGKRDSPLAN